MWRAQLILENNPVLRTYRLIFAHFCNIIIIAIVIMVIFMIVIVMIVILLFALLLSLSEWSLQVV